jgi:hypothetical protein
MYQRAVSLAAGLLVERLATLLAPPTVDLHEDPMIAFCT